MRKETAIKKRLFLFAAYDKTGIINPALEYYIKNLFNFGDIIFVMDSDTTPNEINKICKYTLYANGQRHGEYDFGSYKRAYQWAKSNLDLSTYDYIYLVNDSVFGPLYDIDRYFYAMETSGHVAFGIVKNPHHDHPHIQSWFVGMDKKIFTSDWFDEFMQSITKLPNKGQITSKYEHGLSKLISEHGHTWDCLYSVPGRGIYNKVAHLYKIGIPFIKKVTFTRNHGAMGGQIKYILSKIPENTRNAIITSANQQYGEKYMKWFLTKNPIKIAFRNIKHATRKLFIEGI